jgi:hypothetical protein
MRDGTSSVYYPSDVVLASLENKITAREYILSFLLLCSVKLQETTDTKG